MPFFSKLKHRGASSAKDKAQAALNGQPTGPIKRPFDTTWTSRHVVLEEVEELVRLCTAEMKTRAEALDTPFLLLPFRPDADGSGVRTFVDNYFKHNAKGLPQYQGEGLRQELRLTDPIVLCNIMKWCWSRMPAGVVTWPVYDGFQIGERESNMARNAFDAFIPLSAESAARKNIIFDFFDLLAAVAAHGKMNGLGGRKLSRLAGWWAFEHSDDGKGFEGGYRSWTTAADASSHLFFAYLRSLSREADPTMSVIERIPRSLQALLAQTEYPPETPTLLQRSTPRVVMLVDSVSPTPFALLRRAAHFEYRSEDRVLRAFQDFEDPINALTDECKRVLYAIASTNASGGTRPRTGRTITRQNETWSDFQSIGFGEVGQQSKPQSPTGSTVTQSQTPLRSAPRSRNNNFGRPTTPSWADFLSSGFADDESSRAAAWLLPPDKQLHLFGTRAQSPSIMQDDDEDLAPGELAAITNVELDDAFWWVWMASLAGEEPSERKAVFGRCALVETSIANGAWLIMEEQVKGASPDPAEGAVIVEKRSRLSRLASKGKLTRKNAAAKKAAASQPPRQVPPQPDSAVSTRPTVAPDRKAKIKAAARALANSNQTQRESEPMAKRGRIDDPQASKTNSILTLGLQTEAGPALKWTSAYDKNAIRAMYLGDSFAGRGASREELRRASMQNLAQNQSALSLASPSNLQAATPSLSRNASNRDLQSVVQESQPAAVEAPRASPTLTEPLPPYSAAQPIAEIQPSKAAPKVQARAPSKEREVTPPSPPIGRKPVAKQDKAPEHPALRPKPDVVSSSPVDSRSAAVIAAQAAMEGNSGSQDTSPSRPNKPSAGNSGLKKLFARKKVAGDNEGVGSQRPTANGVMDVPYDSKRDLSDPRKDSQTSIPQTGGPEHNEPLAADVSHFQQEPRMADFPGVSAEERRDAEYAFSRFDQGPMYELPVADPAPAPTVPRAPAPAPANDSDSDDYDLSKVHREDSRPKATAYNQYAAAPESKVTGNDAASAASVNVEQPEERDPDRDRWAQIRENARRRHAKMTSEAESMQSKYSRPTDEGDADADGDGDGDTSGEETIESRVARIKARVAELTGNATGVPLRT